MHLKKTCLLFLLFLSSNNLFSQSVDPLKPDFNPPAELPGMSLIWNDEFNTNGKPDSATWRYENGFVRNQELQWYQSNNATCSEGVLVITGKKERVKNPNYDPSSTDWKKSREYAEYTSSSINTAKSSKWQFGSIVVRARLNTSKGAWPAIWTLGVAQDWPSCGEIDIMEFYRVSDVPTILANFAWGTDQPWVAKWDSKTFKLSDFQASDANWTKKFHEWRLDWNKDTMKIFLDKKLLNDALLSGTKNANGSNPFLQQHYILLNLAIGANGGDPSQSTFPITYEVDYVRVYQSKSTDIKLDNKEAANKTTFAINRNLKKNSVEISVVNNTGTDPIRFSIITLNGRTILSKTIHYDLSTKSYRVDSENVLNNGLYIVNISGSCGEKYFTYLCR